jgi:hypothetical protein
MQEEALVECSPTPNQLHSPSPAVTVPSVLSHLTGIMQYPSSTGLEEQVTSPDRYLNQSTPSLESMGLVCVYLLPKDLVQSQSAGRAVTGR